jgi:hypothetical protein
MARLLFNRVGHLLVRALLVITPYPLSNVIIRYLIVGSVVQGLRKYVREHRIPLQPPLPDKGSEAHT